MRSLILGSSAIALLIAAPASADEAVTTGETDDSGLPNYELVIVKPEDGAVIEGNPDALVPITVEHHAFEWVSLYIDGQEVVDCSDQKPCLHKPTLAPGLHELRAFGVDGIVELEHVITIEVVDIGSATEGPASASVTDSDTGSSDTTATDTDATTADSDGDTAIPSPTSSTTDSTPGGTDGDDSTDGNDGTDGDGNSGSGDKEGCGCTTRPGGPDLLGLALFALVAPWRRRGRA